MCGQGQSVSVASPPGRGEKGRPVDEVVLARSRLPPVLSEGGMGRAYQAHNSEIARDVAIKVSSPELATEPGYEQRFWRSGSGVARPRAPDRVVARRLIAMPVAPGAAGLRQQCAPRNFQGVRRSLVMTGRDDRAAPSPQSLTPDIFPRGDST